MATSVTSADSASQTSPSARNKASTPAVKRTAAKKTTAAAKKAVGTARKAATASRTAPAARKTASAVKAAVKARAASATRKTAKPTAPKPTQETATLPSAPKTAPKNGANTMNGAKTKHKAAKLVRDSFTMPGDEYSVLGDVKRKCLKAGIDVKKSELLRIGVSLIRDLEPAQLNKILAGLPSLKAGRPRKEKGK